MPPDAAALEQRVDNLDKSTDALDKRVSLLTQQTSQDQGLLSVVLIAAGLISLIQGVFAFFNAKNFMDQADDAVKAAKAAGADAETAKQEAIKAKQDAVKQMAELREQAVNQSIALGEEIRSKFPLFGDIESALTYAFKRLTEHAKAFVVKDYENLYRQCEDLTRQEIFSIDNVFAIQSLSSNNRSSDLIEHLQLLGRFYAGKFLMEMSEGAGQRRDYERAFYYFDLAQIKSNRSYYVLNDIGWLYSLVGEFDRARALFEESLRYKGDQQRALYNLGTQILRTADRSNRAATEEGLKYLNEAKNKSNWEEIPSRRVSHLFYNLACFCDRKASTETDPSESSRLLDECCDYLENAAKNALQSKSLLEEDLSSGDLRMVAKSAAHADRLKGIKSIYESSWSHAS